MDVSPTESLHRTLLEENRVLKELLKQAVKREADALRKLTHLSKLVKRRADGVTCTGSSSDPELEDGGAENLTNEKSETPTEDKKLNTATPSENYLGVGTSCRPGAHSWKFPVSQMATECATLSPPFCTLRKERERPLSLHHSSQDLLDSSHSDPTRLSVTPNHMRTNSSEYLHKSLHTSITQSPVPGNVRLRNHSNSVLRRGIQKISRNRNSYQSTPVDVPMTIESLFKSYLSYSSLSSTKEQGVAKYIGLHWTDVVSAGVPMDSSTVKHHDAVWELFQEETRYLNKQLYPLDKVYKGFLEELHFNGILQLAEVNKIFANLSELCELSSGIAIDLSKLFLNRPPLQVASTNELVLTFSMFGRKFNPVYQKFCVNVEKNRGYLKALHQLPDFEEYIRVCRNCEKVQKNDIESLIIAPLQHLCHYQLLLEKILRHTKDPNDCSMLSSTIKAIVVTLKELESNIAEHQRSLELLELQELIHWSPLLLQPDLLTYLPESWIPQLSEQPKLATKDRVFIHKGTLKLLDAKFKPSLDIFVVLLSDYVVLTEQRSKSTKKQLAQYVLYQHPIPLASLEVCDAPLPLAQRNMFTLLERSPLGCFAHCYTLQAESKEEKDSWLAKLRLAQDRRAVEAREILQHKESPV